MNDSKGVVVPYLLLGLAAVMFGLYNVFIKLSADHIQAVLGAVILQFVAAFLGLGLLIYLKYADNLTLHLSPRGVTLAVLAGAAIGVVEILTFIIYGRGVDVAVGNPLIVGGSLIVTTGIGWLFLREVLNPWQVVAVLSIIAGVVVLAWQAGR
ncbi:MAG: EamA family transporter [Pseudomonas sp.]|nr:EamA family transporter [Pseudomonas sp.]MDD2224160.1 EamA family transporter [Pseudomonas sp.]MDY0413987.1 EamA family transporter [Pseudomonas sp.]NLO54788.1 EamA family transporter [Gammaproteobacteria bacterium]